MPKHDGALVEALPKATSAAVLWATIDILARQGSQFFIALILAHLLTPNDFGVMALVAAFATIATVLVDAGFAIALIRQPTHNDVDASTAFWFNFFCAIVIGSGLALLGRSLANFYGTPVLSGLAIAMGANIVIASSAGVHTALLTRAMNFRIQAAASGASNIIGGLVAIGLAIQSAGPWALVAQVLIASSVNSLVLWRLHAWRPMLTFNRESFGRLYGFGFFMMASSVLDLMANRFHAFIIGKIYSPAELGIYSRGLATRDFGQNILASLLTRLSIPILSQHADDPAALRRRVATANKIAMTINLPLMLGIASSAEELVPFLFGAQWQRSTPILSVLCLAGAIWPLQLNNVNLLSALGLSGRLAAMEIAKKAILVLSVIGAAPFGMIWIAWATVFASVMAFIVNAAQTRTFIGYSATRQLMDVAGSVALATTMGILVLALHIWQPVQSQGWLLALEIGAAATWYVAGITLFRVEAGVLTWRLFISQWQQRLPDTDS
ncbi:lipopolysaccharide biosynthesis protein [Luteibacter sp.]|jgi:O-antigen/teichoic acid export membrane protein|uniref:lipopolysaccharide biosynthesis protein n=1 Tax=Luteibacter sp. TaxID=1886636 RepID=UPI002F4083FC